MFSLSSVSEFKTKHDTKKLHVRFRWNELIGSSSQIMSKFRLSLVNFAHRRWTSSEHQVLQLKRKYQHLKVVLNGYDDVASVSRVLKRHGSHLRSVEAYAATFDTPESAYRFLTSMPLVQTLVIHNCKILTINAAGFPSIALQSLRRVELLCSSWRFLEFLESCPVEWLTVEGGYKGHAASLVDFLSNARHLKKLHINSVPFKTAFRDENSRHFKFNLNRLEVAYSKATDNQLDENFNAFLSTQKCLRDLNLTYPASRNIWRTVFYNHQHLTSLTLLVNNLPSLWEFYESLQPLKYLQKLEIIGQFSSEVEAIGILTLCPNIEDLSAETDFTVPSLLPLIAANNQCIQKLSILAINQTLNSDVVFKNLRHFEVDWLPNQNSWLSFVKIQPSLENLKVRKYSWHTFSEELTNTLDRLTNVKSILFIDFHDNLQMQ